MQESFPFDHVVITFPDSRAAAAARQGPLLHIRRKYPHTRLIATTDPHDARVGSGGGTLAALPAEGSTVLMLHAGGQSSRCPTQMVLGKAWTSLPTREHQLITPIEVWIQQCHELFQGIPKGTLVVVSSDTLLQLPHSIRPQWSSYEGVLGLAVPAPLHTAQNHGVFSLSIQDNNHQHNDDDSEPFVASCQAIYQKPSLEVLETIAVRRHAWIDTGVILFFPSVTQSLRRLAQSTLAACTASGLETMWKRESSGESLLHFARRAALPVDLYTHFLQAFRLEEGSSPMSEKKRRYCEKYRADGISMGTLISIFDTLHRHTLRVLAFPKGQFLHLGTTRELVEFYAMAHPLTREERRRENRLQLCASFCEHLGLTHRLHALTVLPEGSDSDSNTVDPSAIIYHSIIESTCGESCIGANTIIEHCSIETDHALRIGRNCLISGLRYSSKNSTGNGDIPFTVPDGTMIQVLPLRDNKGKTIQFVHMVLDIDDAIKHRSTLYGFAFERFLSWAFLSDEDVWPDEETESKQTLWTAELHPVVESGLSCASVFSWLSAYAQGKKTSELLDWEKVSLSRWKSSRRLSLAQIRDMADASKEFSDRQNLIGRDLPNAKRLFISNIRDALMNRELSPLNFQFILDDFAANGKYDDVQKVLSVLIEVISRSLRNETYDICGQACAISSSFLSDFHSIASSCVPQLNEMLSQTTWEGASFLDTARKISDECDTIESNKDSFTVLSLSVMLEQASFEMTRKCICDVASQWQLSYSTKFIVNQWVLATAPARIDFSGGWSDTAPICYHGSSVVGAAVALGDDLLPLSCRCRIVSGGRGVYLRTEQRNLGSGALESSASQTLSCFHDLQDFRYPESSCALLKCALYTLGMVLPTDHPEDLLLSENVFQEALNSFCGNSESDVMLEIISTSLLPHGSGMGTSSILGGCVLAAVLRCIGKGVNGTFEYQQYLIEQVLRLEQHLSTGGGFQDQVNGLIGGVKIVRCEPQTFPPRLNIEQLALPSDFEATINSRLHIAFTGQTRLAKNILQDVLQRWSKRTKEITETVEKLVLGAESAQEAFLDGDIETVADCVNDYWNLKKVMAGPASGVAPPQVESVIDKLMEQGLVAAASLCGAGGGGFLVVISTEGNVTKEELDAVSNSEIGCNFVWHKCRICSQGLSVQVIESNERNYFDIKWHHLGL